MHDLLNHLETIRQAANAWHYAAQGASQYAQHLLADRVSCPIGGFIDDIKEIHFLGNLQVQPPHEVATTITDQPPPLNELLTVALYHIEELARADLMQGELNLLGAISEHMLRMRGLVGQTIEGDK